MLHALAAALLSQTLVVGPSGFATIQEAVDAAAPGDVISVAPGTYSSFTLTKSLSVIAESTRPTVVGPTLVAGTAGFSLVGLRFENLPNDAADVLRIENVNGRGNVDDCEVDSDHAMYFGLGTVANALVVDGSSEIVITRCTMIGNNGGLTIQGSNAAVTDSTSTARVLFGGSSAYVVASDVVFAGGQIRGSDVSVSGCGYPAGHAIAATASRLTILGTTLIPGFGKDDCGAAPSGCHIGEFFNPFGPSGANVVYATGPCLVPGGAIPDSGCSQCYFSTLLAKQFDPPAPRLAITGADSPGSQRTIELYGDPSHLGVVGFSVAPAYVALPGQGQFRWIGLGPTLVTLLFAVGQTYTTPWTQSVTIPPADPALNGLVLHAQGFFPALPGLGTTTGVLVTNPSNIILRP